MPIKKINKNRSSVVFNILFLIYVIIAKAQSDWEWQNPLPQGADMFAIIPLSPNRAIITGSGGTIMTTEDNGQNWYIQRLAQVDWVRKYSFISENIGWIIGNWYDITTHKDVSKIFKTYNGGLAWQELKISLNIDFTKYSLNDIEFINSNKGYLLANPKSLNPNEQDSYPGLIFKTQDGGSHWTQIDIELDRKYYQILFIDSLTGFLLSQPFFSHYDFENNMLHKTTDGGKTWITLNGTGFGIIHFINDLMGWAGNYKTKDGGQTWKYQQFNFPSLDDDISKICFVDSMIGYAISSRSILQTQDGGNSWTLQKKMMNGYLQDIQFCNSQIGYACGYGGTIYQTNDGGKTWFRHGEGTTEHLEDLDFIDENTGWVVGYYGTILQTKNSGETWGKISMPVECCSTTFRGIDFIDYDKGWIAGGNYVLNTQNGGQNWNIQINIELNKSGRFRDIKFINDKIGFVVGQLGSWPEIGIIFKTLDGGENWLRIDEGDLPILDEIYFIDNDYGWICGYGILLSTQDGGESWSKKYFDEFLRYMQFTNHNYGWVSSLDEGAVYRTTDGGKSWLNISYYDRFELFFNSFFFFNNNQGISSSVLNCNILKTEDSGLHWSYQERLPPIRLNAIKFVNDSLGWAIGTNGAILRYKGSYFNSNNIHNSETIVGNYPNPFHLETSIYFLQTKPQNVTISIYNIIGERIETFRVSNTSIGKNIIQWHPGNIVSGLYFIKIQCTEYTKVSKCLFLK